MKKDITELLECIQLVSLSKGFRIEDFKCEIEEYSKFLIEHALEYQESGVSSTHLIINKRNADVIAYMVLVADSIKPSDDEKEEHHIGFIPFPAIPAIKIGKLAVDNKYHSEYKGIGSLMIEIARGIAQDISEKGVACKFITIDADVENNPTVIEFYQKNGFKLNEKHNNKKHTETISILKQ